MPLRVLSTDRHILNMKARIPFRFGITTMTATPHLFLRVAVDVDGDRVWGIAADHLPPKWFTKDPNTHFRDDVADMQAMIATACSAAVEIGEADDIYSFWKQLYERQRAAWAGKLPPLLYNFGVSLIERAVIDAWCRARRTSFWTMVHENHFNLVLEDFYPELAGWDPSDLVPHQPLRSIVSRHTVGLSDPLTEADIADADRADDTLPQSLEASIRAYGLTQFKIKLLGDVSTNLDRLRRIAAVLDREVPGGDYRITVDGNENFKQVEPFRDLWNALSREPSLASFLGRLIFVEQPLHRDVALSDEVGRAFAAWPDRPPIIIDESDAEVGSAGRALELGYAGTSHKNCKGVLKGMANACLIEKRRRTDKSRPYMISGEDLSNVGPVALLQDLSAVAAFGIESVERNGQHYFKGLSALPPAMQDQVLAAHGDLYRRHEGGFVTMNIQGGRLDIASVVENGFGMNFELDPTVFTPAERWEFSTLGLS